MSITKIQRKLNYGHQRHLAGDTHTAAQTYAEILHEDPANADAWHLSGLIAFHAGRIDDAEQMIGYALELAPGTADYQSNLAAVLLAAGKAKGAEGHCRAILRKIARHAGALKHLSSALRAQERTLEALEVIQLLAAENPHDASVLCNLGAILNDCGQFIEAEAAFVRSRELDETRPEVHLNLGAVQRKLGQPEAAMQSLTRAVELNPEFSEAYTNRGNLLQEMHQPAQAIQDYQRSLELNPMSIAALSGLGQSLPLLGHWDEAMEAVRLASQLAGSSSGTGKGSLTASIRRRLMSNLLYCASLSPGLNRDDVFEMHAEWGRAIEREVRPFDHPASELPEKRLRIGYVSPDFRSHPTMRFFLPFFTEHDREEFDICCYSECSVADAVTERVRAGSTLWRETSGLGDQQLAELIHSDRIDVLVDLAGHTSGNRLPSFAFRPSPIQVSFLGYPNTTGLTRMDYLLVDAVRENADTARYFTEQTVAMPHGACCFQSLSETTSVAEPPFLRNGHVTFGSTHRLEKLSRQCLQLWAALLNRLPTARLRMIRDVIGTSEQVRRRLLQQLAEAGIDVGRVDLVGTIPANHLHVYSQIDVLLDVFPWPSGTTVYESHWMGVPMPAIADRSIGSCASASCLYYTGLHNLIGRSFDEYLDIVMALVSDRERLIGLRQSLRPQMQKSVCNGVLFSRDIEVVYRSMWRRFCGKTAEQAGLPLIASSTETHA